MNEVGWKSLFTSLNDAETYAIEEVANLTSKIVKKRKSLGLTQEEVAKRAGITQVQVARIENSSAIPKWDTVIKVAYAVGLRIKFEEVNEQ